MYEYDLAVYGHITVDRIIRNFKEEISLGAIANFWNALNVINTNIKYKSNFDKLRISLIIKLMS